MAESIKDKVAIVGMGCPRWGELWDKGPSDLLVDAAYEAFEDAGIEPKDVEAAWVSNADNGLGGTMLAQALQLQFIPVTHIENICASAAEALRNAAFGVASKTYDLVLAIGFEKLKDWGISGLNIATAGCRHPVYGSSVETNAPALYALAATRYFARYGLTPEEGKRMMAKTSVKSHYQGAKNPRAHLRREVTIEQVMKAPIIAWPLGLYDCCGVTDGSAAAILCRTEDAKRFRDDYVTIKACAIAVGPGWGREKTDYDLTHWQETEAGAKQAYEMAGIKNPREELDMIENHDCFSIAELICVESLGVCEKGHIKEDVDAGTFIQAEQPKLRELLGEKPDQPLPLEGKLVVNHSGGLKSFGHPIGASGIREVYEIYKQIQGKAEEPVRQLKDVRLGLAHNQGGYPGQFMCGITIIGAPE
jgi:acetyl-CoA C-acetyltransferase